MTALVLTSSERKEQRSLAHHLEPVVTIGHDGLSPSVVREIDKALLAHGLIKVRVLADVREDRENLLQQVAEQLDAAPIQHIGKLLVFWRSQPDKERSIDPHRLPGPKEVKVLKYSKRGGQRPEVKMLRVLGNQRLTGSGKLKRAKVKKVSIKKQTLG